MSEERFDHIDQQLATMSQQLETFGRRFDGVDQQLEAVGRRFDGVDQRLEAVGRRFDGVDQRLEAVDHRFDGVDQRLDAVDRRFDGVDQRLDAVDRRFDGVDQRLEAADRRFDGVDQRLIELRADMNIGFDELRRHMGVLHEEALDRIASIREYNGPTREDMAGITEMIGRRLDPLEATVRQHSVDIAQLKQARS